MIRLTPPRPGCGTQWQARCVCEHCASEGPVAHWMDAETARQLAQCMAVTWRAGSEGHVCPRCLEVAA